MNTLVMSAPRQPIQNESSTTSEWLLAGIVHELNNPLTTILGFSELLLRDGNIDPSRLEKIRAEAERGVRIVRNVLRMARADASGYEVIDAHESIRNTVELAEYPLRQHGVELRLNLCASAPKVFTRAGELTQVFLNLVTNAIQAISAARSSGEIEISSAVIRGHVRISVSDDGPGIREADIHHIFEPFFTTKENGNGLGLSLSHKIIRENGGDIWVSSTVGCGATFTLELPALPDSFVVEEEPASDDSRFLAADRSVLIVDDEDHITELIDSVLHESGYQSDRLNDGESAIELLKTKDYDILICDFHMPGIDGRGLIEWVRSNRKNTRILLLSGDVVRKDTQEFAKAYGAHFLSKPFSVSELTKAVQRLFS